MKNKTIINILSKAEMFKQELLRGMTFVNKDGKFEFPTDEEIREHQERINKEYEEWLNQEIEEVDDNSIKFYSIFSFLFNDCSNTTIY